MAVLERQKPEVAWESPKFVEDHRVRMWIGASGRLVIPAAMREALGMVEGEMLDLRVVDGELRTAALRARLRRAQERASRYVKPGTLVSEELSAERREAAKHE